MPVNKKRHISAASDGEPQVSKRAKKGAKPAKPTKPAKSDAEKTTDTDDKKYWELGKNRRVSTLQFKGSTLVSIREYYGAPDGELKPGKKGIALSLDQYKEFLAAIPEINEELRSQGHAVGDPPASAPGGVLVKTEKPKESAKPKRSNIEETSDEDDAGAYDD
ncbi:PC4-domain-containing protein [Trichocladium antarcticum]|uniref:PC4-domain-containing protein n=1 Tax=Trichocladium antarcticum TaxID=1450529 RepID=A0AAN6ZAJ8_9PEZI|nr:PC4-domain-containing protein [Trichocladium antarcticum]